jgi:hypothetical protein
MIYKKKIINMEIKAKVWSNLFFILPFFIALYYQLIFHSLLIILVLIFSSAYHYSNEKKFGIVDKIFAYLLIAYNLYLCYLSNFKLPYILLAFLFVCIGLYFLFIKNKDDYEWHIASAIITIFCLFAYISTL